MIRIVISAENAQSVQISVDGRIVVATAGQLDTACAEHLESSRLLELNLAGVSFVDRCGLACLRGLQARGAKLTGCSAFLRELLRPQPTAPARQSSPADIDANLISRLRSNEVDAFEAVVRSYGGRMLATAKRLLGNDVDAEDATQDAFLAAYRAIGRFAGDARLSTWLHRVVVNTSLSQLRSKRRKPEQPIDDLLPRFEETGEWINGHTVSPGESEALLDSNRIGAMVRAYVDRLPAPYRAVLLVRDIEEFDTKETAQLLGLSVKVAKIRLHRARQALKAMIERERLPSGSVLSVTPCRRKPRRRSSE